jgi:hypothetical protein
MAYWKIISDGKVEHPGSCGHSPGGGMRNVLWRGVGAAAAVALLGGGCGSDSEPESPLLLEETATASGDGQTADAGAAVPDPLRIRVTREGRPQANITVTWSTSDGSLEPASGPTGNDGIATSTWTLGPIAGSQTAQAAVQDAIDSPVVFSATATPTTPPPPSPDPLRVDVQ